MDNLRILLVEDEEHIREGIVVNLEDEGFEVIEADNGLDALDYAKKQRFNLIILDIMLPEVDGIHICEQIRLEDTDTPILFLTAKDSTADKVLGFEKRCG